MSVAQEWFGMVQIWNHTYEVYTWCFKAGAAAPKINSAKISVIENKTHLIEIWRYTTYGGITCL